MAVLKLTTSSVKSAPVPASGDAYYWDNDREGPPGFGLRVTKNGVRSFVYQYRLKDRPARRITLGKFGELTESQARKLAASAAAKVRAGVDPVEERKREKREAKTLEFASYVDHFAKLCLKEEWPDSWEEAKRALELHVVPILKGKALPAITGDNIKEVIDPLRPQKALARKVWAILGRLFSWAVEEEDIARTANPMLGRKPPAAPKARKRVLSPDEVVAAWRASYKLNDPFGAFVRLLFATLQRRTEVAGMPWKEADQERALWTIDAERAKNDEDHLAPLNALAVAELEALGWARRGFVLSTTGKTPISGFSRMKKQLDRYMLPILQEIADERAKALGEDPESVTMERWTLHDVRRSGATTMQSLGVPVEVTEAVLNHTSGESREGIRGVYNLWKYEPEKREALNKWGRHLERLVSSAGGNVVALSERRA